MCPILILGEWSTMRSNILWAKFTDICATFDMLLVKIHGMGIAHKRERPISANGPICRKDPKA
uniref:Uncharacterized protein n=1 Tax=Romanomermis culicivorax TaxID=13658 RepID=A0A915J4R0_ROMCU